MTDTAELRDRLQGCYVTRAHHVPRRRRAVGRPRRHAQACELPDRRRDHHRQRRAAGLRRGRGLLHHDLRRAGGGDRRGGGGGRRAGAGGDGRPDHQHQRAGAPGPGRGRDRRRVHAGVAAVLLRPHRRRLHGARGRGRGPPPMWAWWCTTPTGPAWTSPTPSSTAWPTWARWWASSGRCPTTGSWSSKGVVSDYSDRFTIIDKPAAVPHQPHARRPGASRSTSATSGPNGGCGCGALLNEGRYVEAQHELVEVVLPFMRLWTEMEAYTSGDGHLDKLCMELVGLPSSRSRPPHPRHPRPAIATRPGPCSSR